MWKSDGTAAGTVLVKDISPSLSNSNPGNLTNINGTLYFQAYDGTNGTELWKSDGTAAGTVLVKDIWSGTGNSNPDYLTNINDTLYFGAHDGINGNELWKLVDNISPTNIALSNSTINENVAANSNVGSFTSTDPDTGNTFTYTLVAGTGDTDNAAFTIASDKLNINASPDFEAKSSYAIRVRTTDQGGLSYEQPLTVTIKDVNEVPTNLSISNSSINENVAANSTIGSFTSTDPDTGNTFTYSLVAGTGDTDNAAFTIASDKLNINASPNFEAKSSYAIRVRTTDQGGLTYEKPLTVTIKDVNEVPTNLSISNSSINENVAANSNVGSFTSTDPDTGNTFTYTLVAGTGDTDNAAFTIASDKLNINASPDFETKSTYNIRVQTTDQGGLTYEQPLTVTIKDIDESVSLTPNNDIFNGTAGVDQVKGLAGSDRIYGNAGNDILDGGDGNDIVYGGDDDDLLRGGNGSDRLYGDAGNDQLYGDAGNDILYGGNGDNLLN
nr:ELWxxDGT repeat protein [Planktothrix sp. FACHB-1365]